MKLIMNRKNNYVLHIIQQFKDSILSTEKSIYFKILAEIFKIFFLKKNSGPPTCLLFLVFIEKHVMESRSVDNFFYFDKIFSSPMKILLCMTDKFFVFVSFCYRVQSLLSYQELKIFIFTLF